MAPDFPPESESLLGFAVSVDLCIVLKAMVVVLQQKTF